MDALVRGFADDRYASVRREFAGNLASGADVGASFCATVDGETVVDLWGGYADAARTRTWDRDTIINVYSATKTMTALTVLLLADRGAIDLDAPVARYWPEFAAAGKGAVSVAHVLSHTAGLPTWRPGITVDDLYDRERVTAQLAGQRPEWEPGTASGYHALTQGFLLDEVVRRVTGESLGRVFQVEIAEPLGADFHIGLPASEDGRVAELIGPESGGPDFPDQPRIPVAETATRRWRAAGLAAAGGTGNARSLARVLAILANGGTVGERRFLSEAGCRRVLEHRCDGPDRVLGRPVRFGLGFALGDQLMPNRGTVYWGGYGGSLVVADLDARTTFAYAMNRMAHGTTGDFRAFGLSLQMWSALRRQSRHRP